MSGDTSSSQNPVLGDMMVLLSCTMYGISNICQEFSVKQYAKLHNPTPITGDDIDNGTDTDRMYSNLHSNDIQSPSTISNDYVTHDHLTDGGGDMQSSTTDTDHHFTVDINSRHKHTYSSIFTDYDGQFEFLSYYAVFGSIFCFILILIFQRSQTMDYLRRPIKDISHIYMFGYAATMLILYSLTPILMKRTSALVFNLSLLTTDSLSVVASNIIFHETFHFVHYVSFFIIIAGVITYNLSPIRTKYDVGL
uniref:Solute carrier family 35 member F1 n=1 Tax=Lygus hesperus TaxID=30085 RepID=A0A0A9WXX9_LYGHE